MYKPNRKPKEHKRKNEEAEEDDNLYVEDRKGEFTNFDESAEKRSKFDENAKKRPKFDDADTDSLDLKYLLPVLHQLNKGFDNDEDKEIFVSNVLKEVTDKFLLLSCSRSGSKLLEKILPLATLSDLVLVTEVFSTNTRKMCIDSFASHVTETLIKVSLELMNKNEDNEDDELAKIKDWAESFYTFVYNNFETFLNEVYACHIIRVLLVESKKHNQFHKMIRKFLKKVIHLEDCSGLFTQPQPVSLFTSFIDTLKDDEEKLDLLIRFLSKQIVMSGSPSESDNLPVLITNQNSSILMEKIMENASPKVFKFLLQYLNTYIPLLVKHPIGNFVLQKVIKNCKKSKQFGLLFDKLVTMFDDILQFGYCGILTSLAQSCAQHEIKQSEYTDALTSALQSSDKKLIFHVIASLHYEAVSTSTCPELNYHGSVIVQHLLNFQNTKSITKSILSLGTPGIVQLACSKFGSHIVDAFNNSKSVDKITKDKLVNLLQDNFVELACDTFGSRSLENIWCNASIEIRGQIATELVSNMAKLRSNFIGCKLFVRFDLNTYKNKPEVWTKEQSRNSNGKKTKLANLKKQMSKY